MKYTITVLGLMLMSLFVLSQSSTKSSLNKKNYFKKYALVNNIIKSNLKSNITTKIRLDSIMIQMFDTITKQNKTIGYIKYIYDNAGRNNEILMYDSMNSPNFKIDRKLEFSFNLAENKINYNDSSYNEIINKFQLDNKFEEQLDINGKVLKELYYDFILDSNKWVATQNSIYYYNNMGKLDSMIIKILNQQLNQWDLMDKHEYYYNNNGDLAQILYKSWNDLNGSWSINSKEEFTCDPTIQVNFLTYQLMDLINNSKILNDILYDWNDETKTWEEALNLIFNYSEINNIGVSELDINTISITPNPVTDNLNIRLPENYNKALLEIYDIQGRLDVSKNIYGSTAIVNISDLDKGMYIYNLYVDDNKTTGKLIKD